MYPDTKLHTQTFTYPEAYTERTTLNADGSFSLANPNVKGLDRSLRVRRKFLVYHIYRAPQPRLNQYFAPCLALCRGGGRAKYVLCVPEPERLLRHDEAASSASVGPAALQGRVLEGAWLRRLDVRQGRQDAQWAPG
jgi:hypothetical protein